MLNTIGPVVSVKHFPLSEAYFLYDVSGVSSTAVIKLLIILTGNLLIFILTSVVTLRIDDPTLVANPFLLTSV
jgi:hypothetical protein